MVSKQGAAVAERKRELFNRIHIEQSVQVCEFLYYLAYKLNIDGSLDTLINIISVPLPVSYNGTHEECTSFKSSNNLLSVNIHYKVFNFGLPWHSVAAS